MADTGHGAALTCAAGWAGVFVSLEPMPREVPKLNVTHLGTAVYQEYTAGDLQDFSPLGGIVLYDPADPPPIGASRQEWVLTFPTPPTKSSGATITGSGFLVEMATPELVTNELMLGSFQLIFDGVDGPVIIGARGTFAPEFAAEFA